MGHRTRPSGALTSSAAARLVRGVAGLLAAALTTVAPAHAIDATVELSVQSAYIWRAMVVSSRPVLQPSLAVEHGWFSAGVWANVDLTDENDLENAATEVDTWLACSTSVRSVDLTLAYYDYSFPHSDEPSTREIWASASFDALLSPSITLVRDVREIDGWYLLVSGSHLVGLLATDDSDGIVATVSVGHGDAAYRSGYFPDSESDGVTDLMVRLDLPVPLAGGMLNMNLQFTGFLESDIHTPGFESRDSNLAGGITYSLSF